MNNKIIITSPCGNFEWQQVSSYVPRIGESVTCRMSLTSEIEFRGIVEDVHIEVRKGWGVNEGISQSGMVISVWLKAIES